MATRLELHELLCGKLGSRNVYFQPPESLKLKYPAIIYSRNTINNRFADNQVYNQSYSYTITVVDSDPDSELVAIVSNIPGIRHNTHYAKDGLNHDAFTLTY